MNELPKVGRYLFAAVLAGFAVQHFVYASVGAGLGPPWILGRPLWGWLMGFVLLLASASIVSGKHVSIVAPGFTALLLVYVEFLHGPRLLADIHNPGPWTSTSELVCIGGAAFVLAGDQGRQRLAGRFAKRAVLVGRLLFAVPLVVFAVQHFLHAAFIATLIPAWIPVRLFWAYFVGVAFLGTSISIASTWRGRLGATLLGAMFCIWVVILHAPRVYAAPHNGNEWTSLFVALAMCGGAWLVAGTIPR